MHCHYEPVTDAARLGAAFGVTFPVASVASDASFATGMPGIGGVAVIVPGADAQLGPIGEARIGRLGLLPAWAQHGVELPQTCECRVDTMKSDPSVRENWWAGRRCVVPVERLTSWSDASGRPEAWSIQRADGEPLALAGLWNEGTGPAGERCLSFCMLTLSASGHAVFARMRHPLAREARMPAILPANLRLRWLYGSLAEAQGLLVPCDAQALRATLLEPADAPAPQQWYAEPDLFAEDGWPGTRVTPHRKPARPRAVRRARPRDAPGPMTPDLFASGIDLHDAPACVTTP